MASDPSVYGIFNRPTVELLDPYTIQARQLAIRNALAAGQMQDQQIATGALELEARRRALADEQSMQAALKNFYGSGSAPPAGPVGAAADSSAVPPAAAAPLPPTPTAPAPVAAAPAAVARPRIPTMGELIQRGVRPAQASAMIEQFQKIDANTAAIEDTRSKTNKLIQQQGSEMANAIVQNTAPGQAPNPELVSWHLQHFASLGPQEAQMAANVGQHLQSLNPEGQVAFLKSLVRDTDVITAQSKADEVASLKAQRATENAAKDKAAFLSTLGASKNQSDWINTIARADPKLVKDLNIPPAFSPAAAARAQQLGQTTNEQITTAETAQRDAISAANERTRLGLEARRIRNEELRASFDQGAIQRAGEALGRGDLTRLKDIASLRGDQRLQIFDIAKNINPNFNLAEVDRKIKMEDYYANGAGAKSLQSFGTFLEHAGAGSEAVNAIRLSGVPAINKPLNWWRSHLSGSPEYTRLIGSLEPVRKEFEGFLLGGHALYAEDRKAAETILSDNSSPAQIQQAFKTMGHTTVARVNEENHRYKKVMGHDLEDAFSPEALAGAKAIGVSLPDFSATTSARQPTAAATPAAVPTAGAPTGLQHLSTADLLKQLTK